MRVRDVRPRHADEVELAALDGVPRGGDVLDAGGVHRGDLRLAAHLAGKVEMRGGSCPHAGDDARQRLLGVEPALDDVDEVDQPGRGEPAGDLQPLLAVDAVLGVLVAGEAEAEDHLGADPLADRLKHLEAEAHPVLEAAAVLVVAPVHQRGEELVEEVAVGGDLDAVEPGGLHLLGAVGVGADDAGDVPVLHRLGVGAVRRLAHGGRREDGQPVVRGPGGAAAEVGDLDHHRGTVVVALVAERLQPVDGLVAEELDVAERLRAVGRHHGGAADHGEADATLGLFHVVEAVAVLRQAAFGVGRLVRGRDHPVLQRQMLELVRLKQRIGAHKLSLAARLSGPERCRCWGGWSTAG